MTIAERIFDLMKKQGKKQSDIARLLDVRPATVSEWKKGKREPLGAHYEKLADYFGVSIDYLNSLCFGVQLPLHLLAGKRHVKQ